MNLSILFLTIGNKFLKISKINPFLVSARVLDKRNGLSEFVFMLSPEQLMDTLERHEMVMADDYKKWLEKKSENKTSKNDFRLEKLTSAKQPVSEV